MATPTVFVSSTFYDLRYVREGIKRFIEQLGFIPVLSEDGAVFYDPSTDTASACLAEVGNADMLVLIIGGRYGSTMPSAEKSVTNAEYQQALRLGIPVFALVEQGTYNDYFVYRANQDDRSVLNSITFPNADSVRIFEFIDEVQGRTANNALVPFRTVSDIEAYLRAQWAGMMHSLLTRKAEEARVADSLQMLGEVHARVELLAEQILRAVGSRTDRVIVELLQEMVDSPAVADLRYVGAPPTPAAILQNETAAACADALGRPLRVEEDPEHSSVISTSGSISPDRYQDLEEHYLALRTRMLSVLDAYGVSPTDVAESEAAAPAVARLPASRATPPARNVNMRYVIEHEDGWAVAQAAQQSSDGRLRDAGRGHAARPANHPAVRRRRADRPRPRREDPSEGHDRPDRRRRFRSVGGCSQARPELRRTRCPGRVPWERRRRADPRARPAPPAP